MKNILDLSLVSNRLPHRLWWPFNDPLASGFKLFGAGKTEAASQKLLGLLDLKHEDQAFPELFIQKALNYLTRVDQNEAGRVLVLMSCILKEQGMPGLGKALIDRYLATFLNHSGAFILSDFLFHPSCCMGIEVQNAITVVYFSLLQANDQDAGAFLEACFELCAADYAKGSYLIQKFHRFSRKFGRATALHCLADLVALRRESHQRTFGIRFYEAVLGLQRTSAAPICYSNVLRQVGEIPGLGRASDRVIFLWPFVYSLVARNSASAALCLWESTIGAQPGRPDYLEKVAGLGGQIADPSLRHAVFACWRDLLCIQARNIEGATLNGWLDDPTC